MSMLIALALQAAPVTCATPAPMPAALAGWRAPITAQTDTLAIGRAYRLPLDAQGAIRFRVAPERPAPATAGAGAGAGAHATMRSFTVQRAGLYRVALESGAWIDVVRGGRIVASAAHGHGAACSGIAKQVDFRLTPGRYVLQLSGVRASQITAMVARIG